jgi:hypothetical protein
VIAQPFGVASGVEAFGFSAGAVGGCPAAIATPFGFGGFGATPFGFGGGFREGFRGHGVSRFRF